MILVINLYGLMKQLVRLQQLPLGEPVLPSGIFYGVAILNTFLIKNSLTIIIDKL